MAWRGVVDVPLLLSLDLLVVVAAVAVAVAAVAVLVYLCSLKFSLVHYFLSLLS